MKRRLQWTRLHFPLKPNYMTTSANFFLLIFAFAIFTGCTTGEQQHASGMFRVAILYPDGEGKTFNMDYYEKNHMPMMAGLLGKNLKSYEINEGMAGRAPGDKAPFVAIGYFLINDVAEYNKTIAANIDTIRADIPKYTNIQPTVQISEIRHLK
jgi:uncharacterized protein (TIGR02118 family)